MKITNIMVEQAYINSKKVITGELDKMQARMKIHETTGMDKGSALAYVTVFLDMIEGKEYHRTINTFATRFYLQNIKFDFGNETFKRALDATDKHTKYYRTLNKGCLSSIEKLVIQMGKI